MGVAAGVERQAKGQGGESVPVCGSGRAGQMYDYVRDRQDRHTHVKPARSAAPTVTPAKRLIHIQRAHCATIVARAGTHTRSHDGGAHMRRSAPHRFVTPLTTSVGRAFPGASPCLKVHTRFSLACPDRRLVVTRPAHSQPARAATMVARVDAACGPQPRWWRSPRGVARHIQILTARCCRSAREGRLSRRLPKFRSRSSAGGRGELQPRWWRGQPQPRWWRDPTVSPPAPLAALGHRRHIKRDSPPPVGVGGSLLPAQGGGGQERDRGPRSTCRYHRRA